MCVHVNVCALWVCEYVRVLALPPTSVDSRGASKAGENPESVSADRGADLHARSSY